MIKEGRELIDRRQFSEALDVAKRALEREPDSNEALLLAGHAAASMGSFYDCLDYLKRVPDDGSRPAVDARCFAGDVLLLHFKRLTAASRSSAAPFAKMPTTFRPTITSPLPWESARGLGNKSNIACC